jgi:hypothetical protein
MELRVIRAKGTVNCTIAFAFETVTEFRVMYCQSAVQDHSDHSSFDKILERSESLVILQANGKIQSRSSGEICCFLILAVIIPV